MDFNKIKSLAKSNKISLKELAEKISLTEVGLHQSLKNKSLKITDLEQIAGILGVPVSSFFDETAAPAKANDYQALLLENSALKSKVIALQDELLQMKKT